MNSLRGMPVGAWHSGAVCTRKGSAHSISSLCYNMLGFAPELKRRANIAATAYRATSLSKSLFLLPVRWPVETSPAQRSETHALNAINTLPH